ncbi:MAG: HAD-IA family hydrolase [Patescibacteria group bacterium]|nr:HAD-IA family hydrolase [Patescibacteria group bacterium]
MIKVLIFDADGVLINGEMFSKILAKEYGISTEITEPFFDGPFSECLVGNIDLKEAISPYLEGWGWKTGVDSFLDYWFSAEHSIDQDLIAYIQECRKRGIKCYVATNQEKHRAEYMLDKLGFVNNFDKLYASAHLGHKKPSLDFYEKLVNDLDGINKEEILFWDDSPKNITAARQFGINAELYTTFEDFNKRMKIYPDFDK